MGSDLIFKSKDLFGAVAGTIFNLSNNLCWHSLDAIWIFSYDKWIGARTALGATYCWNAVDAKK